MAWMRRAKPQLRELERKRDELQDDVDELYRLNHRKAAEIADLTVALLDCRREREREQQLRAACEQAATELGGKLQAAEDRIVRVRAVLNDPGLSSGAQVRAALTALEEVGTG